MAEYEVIKVRKDVMRKIRKILGLMMAKTGEKITLSDLLNYMADVYSSVKFPKEDIVPSEINEFCNFLRAYIPISDTKIEKIKQLINIEGVEILGDPEALEELLCDIVGLSRTRVRAVLKRWSNYVYRKKRESIGYSQIKTEDVESTDETVVEQGE